MFSKILETLMYIKSFKVVDKLLFKAVVLFFFVPFVDVFSCKTVIRVT
jgi:hypothetical protein